MSNTNINDNNENYLRNFKELSTETDKKETRDIVEKQEEKKTPVTQTLPETNTRESNKIFDIQEILLVIINVISLVFIFVLIVKIPEKAQELKVLRETTLKDQAAVSFQLTDIFSYQNDLRLLDSKFLDESGVVLFVNDIESLKSPDSAIQKVSFTSQKPIRDRTGNFGIPVAVEMTGTEQQIENDIQNIQDLPYLFRTITFETRPSIENESLIVGKYGILLYVKESLGGNTK